MPLFGKQGRDLGPAPNLSIADMQRLIAEAQSAGSSMMAGEGEGSSALDFSGGMVPQLQAILDYMVQNGLTNTSQVPEAYKRFLVPTAQDKTFGDQLAAFITNPAVLTAAGGVAGVYAAPAGAAGAAAGEGAYGAGYGVGNATTAGTAGAGTGAATSALPAGSFQTAAANTGTMTDVAPGLLDSGGAATVGGGTAAGLTAAEEAALLGAADVGGGTAAAAGTGAAATGSSGGMVPGEGAYSETGMGGWEGGNPGGPGLTEAGSSTALGRMLEGTATSDDYLRFAGQIGPSLLSAYGSKRQADAQGRLAAEYRGMGAPYRSKLAALYENPNAFLTSPEVQIPVQQGTDAVARALSTKGNPAGSGTALQEIQNYSANQLFGRLGQEKDRLAGFGGLSYYNQAAPQAATNAITAQGQVYGDLGYGVGQALNPQQQSLAALLKQYNTAQGLA